MNIRLTPGLLACVLWLLLGAYITVKICFVESGPPDPKPWPAYKGFGVFILMFAFPVVIGFLAGRQSKDP